MSKKNKLLADRNNFGNKETKEVFKVNDFFEFEKYILPSFETQINDFMHMRLNNEVKSFGLYGSWGNGKTTLLQIYSNNNPISNCIFIDLWNFELLDNDLDKITEFIFSEILRVLDIKTKKKQSFKKVLKKSWNAFSNLISAFKFEYNEMSFFLDLPNFDLDENSSGLEDIFLNIKNELSDKKILLIFDNIDRCSNYKIEKYINFIKHVASRISENVKTLIVMDYAYVSKIIFPGDKQMAKIFFDKIIFRTFLIEDFIYKINHKIEYPNLNSEIFNMMRWNHYDNLRSRENINLKIAVIEKTLHNLNLKTINKTKNAKFLTNLIFVILIYNEITENNMNIKIKRFLASAILRMDSYTKGIGEIRNKMHLEKFLSNNKIIEKKLWEPSSTGYKLNDFLNETAFQLIESKISLLQDEKNIYVHYIKCGSHDDNSIIIKKYYERAANWKFEISYLNNSFYWGFNTIQIDLEKSENSFYVSPQNYIKITVDDLENSGESVRTKYFKLKKENILNNLITENFKVNSGSQINIFNSEIKNYLSDIDIEPLKNSFTILAKMIEISNKECETFEREIRIVLNELIKLV